MLPNVLVPDPGYGSLKTLQPTRHACYLSGLQSWIIYLSIWLAVLIFLLAVVSDFPA